MNSDRIDPLPLPESAIILRTSLDRRTRRTNEFAFFATHEDIVQTHLGGSLRWRSCEEVPTVGFCGVASRTAPPPTRQAKLMLQSLLSRLTGYHVPRNDGIFLRREAILGLEAAEAVETNFIIRDEYFGGGMSSRERVRREYVDNILNSDYVLCVRGWGNFSFRFFEAMALGRTPLLIDTECVLPYDFLHDYRNLCVILPASRVRDAALYVREHHSHFDADSWLAHQQRVRRFWEEWLSPRGFFEHLDEHRRRAHGAAIGGT